MKTTGGFICRECGHWGAPKKKNVGSLLLEIVIWAAFIVLIPALSFFGLIVPLTYTIWRFTNKYPICSECDSKRVVSDNSPAGKKLLAEYHS